IGMLSYLRQTIVYAWEQASFGGASLTLLPVPGPVHLNIPFRDPLAPIPQVDTEILKSQFQLEDFFTHLR
ncbi:MAG TPA: hypothetical protein DCE56_30200, partial [Cyanobacteria bacterium UBA8553]|nr:hypothetical protein [Cyanobacteria bacterium UBA8553]